MTNEREVRQVVPAAEIPSAPAPVEVFPRLVDYDQSELPLDQISQLRAGSKFTVPDLRNEIDPVTNEPGNVVELERIPIAGQGVMDTRERALIIAEGEVSVVGVHESLGVLVRYTSPPELEPGGAMAKDGALFFISPAELLSWPEMNKAQAREAAERATAVEQLLALEAGEK